MSAILQAIIKEQALLANAVLQSASRAWIPHEPTERQSTFLDTPILESFYGGSAGGGKSDALLMGALEYADVPGYSALLLRRTYADLSKPKALMDRAREWLSGTSARWVDKEKKWVFPSGASLSFGYLEHENDKYNYQSAEYQFIGFDELTQFSESQYTYLFSRLRRLKGVDVPLRMRSASNPGNIGAIWVKRRFIPDDFSPAKARKQSVFFKIGHNANGDEIKRLFVPATLADNPYLDAESYTDSLNELDPVTREQLLKGDWSIQQRGNIYPMWDERVHVISRSQFARVYGEPDIPLHWNLARGQDWGSTPEHPCVTTWMARSAENSPLPNIIFIYRELVMIAATPGQVIRRIKELEAPRNEAPRVGISVMSHEAKSVRDTYAVEHKVVFVPATPDRNGGIAQMREYLEVHDEPHPFKPGHQGASRLYMVVDDEQYDAPVDDHGLARHRLEYPIYHYAESKSGEPAMRVIPYPLVNDAADSDRIIALKWFPRKKELTDDERVETSLPEHLKAIALQKQLPQTTEQEMTELYLARQRELAERKKKIQQDNEQPVYMGNNFI